MAKSENIDAILGLLDVGSKIYQTKKESDLALGLAQMELESKQDTLKQQQEFELSKTYINNELNKENALFEYGLKVQDDAMKLGITSDSLNKISEIDKTDGSDNLIKRDAESITKNINRLNAEINLTRNNISEYYKGKSVANTIDVNTDGIVSPDELEQYSISQNTEVSDAFNLGVKAYTASPESLLKLQSFQLDIEANQIKNKWLGKNYKQEYDINDVKLNISNKELEKMDIVLTDAANESKIKAQTVALNDLKIKQLEAEVDDLIDTQDMAAIENQIINFGELYIENKEGQSALGVLATSKIQWGKTEDFKTLYTMLTAQDIDSVKDIIDKMSDNEDISLIVGDISEMYVNISSSKGDPLVSDYTGFLTSIDKQTKFYTALEQFVSNNYQIAFKDELESTGITPTQILNDANLMKEMMSRTVGFDKNYVNGEIGIESDYEDYQLDFLMEANNSMLEMDYSKVAPIYKGYQWYMSGLFDDKKLLNQISNTVKQSKSIELNIENLRLQKADIMSDSPGLFYQTTVPRRTTIQD